MKKAAIFSITAFYLLLTTGTYACIVHCLAERLTAKPAMLMAENKRHEHHHKDCKDRKDCDCCKKHGNFLIRENIKPGSGLQISLAGLTIHYTPLPDFNIQPVYQQHFYWTGSHGPPGISGKAISIQLHSLRI